VNQLIETAAQGLGLTSGKFDMEQPEEGKKILPLFNGFNNGHFYRMPEIDEELTVESEVDDPENQKRVSGKVVIKSGDEIIARFGDVEASMTSEVVVRGLKRRAEARNTKTEPNEKNNGKMSI
jgi:hypothetical protein